MPGGLPERLWNVDAGVGKVPNMRSGKYASYRVKDGEFAVKFHDGTITTV